MPLSDEHASVVNTLGQAALKHLCLQTPLQEVFDLERKHVIETHPVLIEHSNTDETTNKGVTLEQPLRVFGIELEKLTRSTTNFRQRQGNAPNLALVAQSVLSSKLNEEMDETNPDTTTMRVGEL